MTAFNHEDARPRARDLVWRGSRALVASASVRLRPPARFAGPSVFARGEDFAGFAGLAGSVFALLFAGIGLLLVAVALF